MMKSRMRSLGAAAAAGAVAAAALVAAPPVAANDGLIVVELRAGLQVMQMTAQSSLGAFGPAEELIVRVPVPSLIIIEVRDDGELGRRILSLPDTAENQGCTALGSRSGTNLISCPIRAMKLEEVRVNFSAVSVDTTVAMSAEESAVPLIFQGGSGSDYVQGGQSNDYLVGEGGDDFLFGGPGDDLLDGRAGDDYVEGEQGRDDMRGGTGTNSLNAADGIADLRVDCGGVPGPGYEFDEGLDKPTNCGEDPTPIPPAPVEPTDPPAPGQGNGTIDGAPTTVEVTRNPELPNSVVVTTSGGPTLNTGLLWIGPTAPEPTFPLNSLFFPVDFTPLMPNTFVDVSIWPVPTPPGPTPLSRSARSAPVERVEISVNGQGVADGTVPVPQGQEPGDFVMQINGVTASGGQMSVNVGVMLAEKTPEPDPGPDESISITSAQRGKGKKAATITVKGTAVGLDSKPVTPRYRVQGAKKWTSAKPVTVSATGTFTWRLKTPKKVRIQVVSGAIRSPGVVVAAAKR
ncbi:MAG: calcium-binding protein [Candidatus Nanopelagicales bacterium]